jgi:hypothetical protein
MIIHNINNRVYRERAGPNDLEVAVLISPEFGAGWSTWMTPKDTSALFDPGLVGMLIAGSDESAIDVYCRQRWPTQFPWAGLAGLVIEWVPSGVNFIVHEYDGAESIQYQRDFEWIVG